MSFVFGHTGRGARAVAVALLLSCMAGLPGLARAQHTSVECPPQSATVVAGGLVSINISDCEYPGNGGIGAIDGGVYGAPDLEDHGTATLRRAGGQWFLDYTHNGTTGIGSTDVFEFPDGSLGGDGDVQVTISITAAASPITVAPGSLPTLTAGAAFSQTLTASGGLAPYTYSLQSGALPIGLSLTSGGVLSGTPTQRGSYSFSVRATDATTPTPEFVDKSYSGTVQNPPLTLVPASATAIQGVAFSQSLSATGGVAPYSFLEEPIIGGYTGLPSGISLAGSTVSGTTNAAVGSYNTRIRVTDSSTGPGTWFEVRDFTLTVSPPPSVSIAVSPASVSEDGATNLTYTVTRSLNLASPTVVNITTGGTATSGTDYTGGVATVSIPAGATTATVVINPTVDGTVEANETVILTVAAGTGYTVGAPASATGTILNDDVPSATISVAPAAVAEDGAPNLVYTVTLNQANPAAATSVNFTVAGTATSGTDFAAVTSPLVIAAGATTGTIVVNPTADATIEADETVILTLGAGAGYTVGAPGSATGTVLNDDLPSLVINDVTVNEGNAGTTNFTFTVSLSAPAGPGGVTFDIATANGTATAGVDYTANSLTGQTIPSGASTYTFTVLGNGDTANEPTETFFVNVTNVTNAIVVDGQGVGTISNDDPLPSLSVDDVAVVEGNAGTVNAVFTVTLSAASGQTVTVNHATADGTGTQPADYTNTSGTLTFTPGQTTRTVTVPVIGETVPEANETFFVNLSGAVNATIADNQGVGTISNDDVPVTVGPTTVPNGTVAAAYSQAITGSGGVGPYSFAVTAGALPAGLSLSPGGVLAGTPTAGGSFNFTVTATDSSPFPGPFAGSRAYTLVVAPPTISLAATSLAGGTLGAAYSAAITPASNGTAPYAYAVTAGALPGGLVLNAATGAITGTPSALGTFNFSITATDSSTGTGPYTATRSYSIVVNDNPPVANPVSITVPYNAGPTNVPLNITGGAPTSVAGSAATNGTVQTTGTAVTYQPNAGYAGPDSFTYFATNSGGASAPATVTVTVSDPVVSITASGGFAATIGAPYTQTFTWNGGAQPWSGYQVTNLPVGLSVTGTTSNSVTISGTPTQAGSFNLNASGTDSSTGNGPYTVGQAFVLTVAGPGLALAPAGTTFAAPYGVAYSQGFSASGGIGPYTYARTGTLPPGLVFSGNTVSGTPTTPGSYSFTITATDAGSTGAGAPFTVAQNYTITVGAPTIVIAPATLPNPTAGAAYSQAITASGGAAPYGFAVSAGSLPSGLTLTGGGTLSGTPIQVGTFNFTVTATDANGQAGARAYTLTIGAPVLTLTPPAGTLTAAYGAAYSQAFTAGGSPGPYSYVLSGALPAGMGFTGNTLSGTPTAPGSYPITVTATDTSLTGAGAPFSITRSYTLNVPAPTVVVDPATLPNPTAGTAYSQAITASGGVAPYAIAVTAGSLPSGLALTTGGTLSGTSLQVGTFNFTVTATDANGQQGTRAYTVTIAAPVLTLTPPAGTLTATYAAPYSQAFVAGGSPGPYSYVLSGALPAGMSFSGNTLSGTPTAPGSYPITVTATDTSLTGVGAPFSITRSYTLNVPAPTIVVGPATLPGATAGAAYSQAITASGGVAPYGFSLTSGALPAGLSLSAGGTLAGTPTASGSFNLTVTATDANGQAASRAYTLQVAVPALAVTPATLPGGTAGTPYAQVLAVSGGVAPYTVTLVGTLPAGLVFDAAARRVSGTPTQSGTFALNFQVRDSTSGTPATLNVPYSLVIAAPALTLAPGSIPAGTAGVAYTQAFSASGGIAPYSYAVGSGALPAGLVLNAATGVVSGTPTVAGTFAFGIRATDSTGGTPASVSVAYSLVLSAPAISITPATLPGAVERAPYVQSLTASGGTAPYAFVVTAGALPAGLSLSAGGQLAGTPTVGGSFSFTVRATDALGFTATQAYAFAVAARPDPTRDAQVRGLMEGQARASVRFATSQILNFQGRLQSLHGAGNAGGLRNALSFDSSSRCAGDERDENLPNCAGVQEGRRGIGAADGGGSAADGEGPGGGIAQARKDVGFWIGGAIRSGRSDARGTTSALDFETDGVSLGADRRTSDAFAFGGGIGLGRDRTDVGEAGSRITGTAYTAAAYASFHPGEAFFLDGLLGWQELDFDLRRRVTANGAMVEGSRGGSQWFASITTGADLEHGAWAVTPYGRLDVTRARLDAYQEQGDAIYALAYGEQTVESSTASAGVTLGMQHTVAWGVFTPQLRLEFQRDLQGGDDASVRYADFTGPVFSTRLDGFDRSRYLLGIGAAFVLRSDLSIRVEYRGLLGASGERDNAIQLNLRKSY